MLHEGLKLENKGSIGRFVKVRFSIITSKIIACHLEAAGGCPRGQPGTDIVVSL
jgi:hypothetical protein